jgi:kumamolisin
MASVPRELTFGPDTVSTEEFAQRYGASVADVESVCGALRAGGFTIVSYHAGSGRVIASGSASAIGEFFGAQVARHQLLDGTMYRARTGQLQVPEALRDLVVGVLGIDDRPQAAPRFEFHAAAAQPAGYTPPQLGKIYNFPAGTDGTGQTIAIIELGGGYQQSDLDAYFARIGTASPKVTAIGVDGASNAFTGDPNGADGEVALDIEVIGGLAPGADVKVYFAPNTDRGFLDAVAEAAHATPTPIAISISWGGAESSWTKQGLSGLNQAIADAVALGVTVTVAAGDDGSSDRVTDGQAHVDFPASSPYALACGGTTLIADPATGVVTSEVVWDNTTSGGATGGGVSVDFPVPAYQNGVSVPTVNGKAGRGVPDVAAVADSATGYQIRLNGEDYVFGGTSAVAPLWAALVARIGQGTSKKFGLIHTQLYGVAKDGFRDITKGSNGAYSAAVGWDACTGLGVPDGERLRSLLG